TIRGSDWFQNQPPPPATIGSGVAGQRQLRVYPGTRFDSAALDAGLNVAEAVVNASSLQAPGLGNIVGKQTPPITVTNPFSASPAYPNPVVGAGFAIIAATLSGVTTSSACYANCDGSTTQPCLTVQDFGCFLNQFAAGNTYANCDGSTTPPILTVQD